MINSTTAPIIGSQLFGKIPSKLLASILFAFVGSCFLTLCAKISIPFLPIPMTLQTFAVVLLGVTMGWRVGCLSILMYLGQGLLGLPVFAEPLGGPEIFFGPTGGYLLGFFPAVLLAGFFAEQGWFAKPVKGFIISCLSFAVIYTYGLIWLSGFLGWEKAIQVGFIPFVLGDIAKAFAVTFIAKYLWKK